MPKPGIQVRQLRVGGLDDNFSYLVHAWNGDAAIVDPCGDIRKIEEAVKEAGRLAPKYILLTHGHHDHVSGVAEVKRFFGAPAMGHPKCAFKCDAALMDRQRLPFGGTYLECLFTPGHSSDSVCYLLGDGSGIFTGDTLFIDCCGYCEARAMFKTMREILLPLPDSLLVYSGHGYGRLPFESLGSQKRTNPYLKAETLESFREELKNL